MLPEPAASMERAASWLRWYTATRLMSSVCWKCSSGSVSAAAGTP